MKTFATNGHVGILQVKIAFISKKTTDGVHTEKQEDSDTVDILALTSSMTTSMNQHTE